MPAGTLAKLTRPRLYGTVARTRLYALLDQQRGRPLVWVVGPPGAGKTVLVASYAESRELRGIWYHADSGDADPATFFYYLGLAAKQAVPRAKQAMPLLTPDLQRDLGAFSRRFFRELFTRLPEGAVLVIDNYHDIDPASPLHGALQDGLMEQPDGVVVIVVSRADPPPGLSRLVALDRVGRVGWEDLRLTLDETRQIATVRSAVDEPALARMYERSEGWVAGLTLMLERLGRTGASDDAAVEAESKEAVFDFFAGEIFERAPLEHQQMLMAASFLPRPTPAAVEAVSGHSGAARLLDLLYRRHLFTDRRSAASPTYQFHDLFRAFLQSRAREMYSAAGVAKLARRAAQILEQGGQPAEAIALALEGEDWPHAQALIRALAPAVIGQGRGQILRDWIGRFPAAELAAAPWLVYWSGASLVATDPPKALAVLEAVARSFRAVGDVLGELLAVAGVVQAVYLEWSDLTKIDPWLGRLAELVTGAPDFPTPDAALQVYGALLMAYFNRRPHDPAIRTAAAHVERLLDEDASPNAKVSAGMALVFYLAPMLEYDRALVIVRKLNPVAESDAVSPLNRMMWWARTGNFLTCIPDDDAARAAVERAEAIAAGEGAAVRSVVVHMPTAVCALVANEVDLGLKAVRAMLANRDPLRRLDDCFIHYAQCVLALLQRDLPAVVHHAELGIASAREGGMHFSEVGMRVGLATALTQLGRHDESRREVAAIRPMIEGTYNAHCEITLLALEAHMAFADGASDEGVRLTRTLMRGLDPRLGTRFLRFQLAVWSEVLSKALEHGIEPQKAEALIARFRVRPPRPDTEHWVWPLRLRVFGGFELIAPDAAPMAAKPPYKLLELLKAIACLGATGVGADTLMELLWPDSEGDAAERAFHTSLYRLRKLVGREDAILLKDGRVSIGPAVCWTDLGALERLTEEIDAAQDTAPQTIARLAERCLALYRGELLAGEREKAWMIAPRDRARSRFRRAVARLGDAYLAVGDGEGATALYRRALERDGLAEDVARRLMTLLRDRGDHAEALAVFRRCRDRLRTALGVEPGPATRAVAETLAEG